MMRHENTAASVDSGKLNDTMSLRDALRRFRELQKATDNSHGIGYVVGRDGKASIAFANPQRNSVVTIPTRISQDEFKGIVAKILPIFETKYIMYELANAYTNRTPIMLEGGTAIGKTFAVNRFAEFLYGPNAQIPDFYCNGQTDVSELMGKYVPAALRAEDLRKIQDYLKSDAGAALKAQLMSENRSSTDDQMKQAAIELGIPIHGSFVFQLGVLPRAMTGTMSKGGMMLDTPQGPGCMLHVQEVGLAAPAVINTLLKIRGDKGELAHHIQVHEDGGRTIESGEGFFLVFSTNPPEKGFKERFDIDGALARGVVWKTLPNSLSEESMGKVVSGIFDFTKVRRQPENPGAILDLKDHPELALVLGRVVLQFHLLYEGKLSNGEPGRKQKIPVTIDSLWKTAGLIQNRQRTYADGRDGVDFCLTLKEAIQCVYIDALRDRPEMLSSSSLGEEAQKQNTLGAALMRELDAILSTEAVARVKVFGRSANYKDEIEKLEREAFGAPMSVQQTAVEDEAQTTATGVKIRSALSSLPQSLIEIREKALNKVPGI